MAVATDASYAQMAFQIQGGAVGDYSVIRFRGTEGLCQLYRFEIEVAGPVGDTDFNTIVGKPAVLSFNTPSGARQFHGIVSRFELIAETGDETFFRAELVPAVWLLTHRYNSRIFQNKTTKDIVSDVLTKAGIAADCVAFHLEGSYSPRDYCVQYRETDYNFICRLMEEEGIWWTFAQSKEKHTFVIADSVSAYKPIEGEAKLPFVPPTGLNAETEHVFRFRIGQAVRPGAVVMSDFNYEKPQLNLQAKADAGRDADLEFSEFPGEYADQSRGTALAKLRAEEFESGRIQCVGQSNCHRFSPALTFELIEHPSTKLNGQYLLTSVTHQGKQSIATTSTGASGRVSLLDARAHQALLAVRQENNEALRGMAEALLQLVARFRVGDMTAHRALAQWLYHGGQVVRDLTSAAAAAGASPLGALTIPNLLDDAAHSSLVDFDAPVYECGFEAVPAAVVFRPPRVTPWPVMRGSQTARIVGPPGEEIHTDSYGRVKVQFHWDREGKFDENASCWIRVSQSMAGGGYGMMFLPRVGQEVVVDFLEGDPDKPLIIGRVYNADHMPTYRLPDEKTKSYIKTNSSTGGGGTNEIRFEDLKDKEQILLYAQKDLHLRVVNDQIENVGHDRHLTVEENVFELVKKARNIETKLDHNEKLGGKRSLEVAGDVGEDFKGSHSEKVGTNYYLKSGGKVLIEAATEVTIKAGGNFIKIDSSGVTILGTKVKVNSGGSAGAGTAVELKAPEAPLEADTALAGKDTTYSGGEELAAAAAAPDIPGYEFKPPEEKPPKKPSWIEIELVDEEGQPVPDEEYEITEPDGKTIKRGSLDRHGQAHVAVPDPGTCQISFPNLDSAAWEKS